MSSIYKTLAFLVLIGAGQKAVAQNFITQWNLATAGSGATQLSFGTATSGIVNYTWQEISPGSATGSGTWSGATLSITGLPTGATIRLQIAPTNFQRININNGSDRNRLTRVEQWGGTAWSSMSQAFYGCANLQVTATDTPNLSSVTDMSYMFFDCSNLNSPVNIGSWNTATVTNMSEMFVNAFAFNQNIGAWNTGGVTNMASMFLTAVAFNQNIASWNIGAVTNMSSMFRQAIAFNQNLGAWTFNPAVNLNNMLDNSGMNCNNYSASLIAWSGNPSTPNGRTLGAIQRQYGTNAVAARTNLTSTKGWAITGDMPSGAVCVLASPFVTVWDLATAGSGATQLSFGTATSGVVNYTWQEISPGTATGSGSWSGATLTVTGLPSGAVIRLQIAPANFQRIIIDNGSDRDRFTQVENWGSTAWTSMQRAFRGCANLQVTATDVPNLSGVSNMAEMFSGCSNLNSPTNINTWNTSAVTFMGSMFSGALAFDQNIGSWNTAAVTNMSSMFIGASAFNQNIGAWNTGAVTNMNAMFYQASSFNQNIGAWITTAVTNMSFMFFEAIAFNQNIGAWNTGAVTNMQEMFRSASGFNQDIGTWNTGAVSNMSRMFLQAISFNQNIGTWNTAAVTNMSYMFASAFAFNNGGSNSINNWNTTAVTNMSGVFSDASAFNQNIGSWNTGSVTNMSYSFKGASAFNQNIGAWNTAAVTNMLGMFNGATAFNQNIGAWNTGAVTDMQIMFWSASAFNQNIGAWNTSSVTDMNTMFSGASAFNQNLGAWTLNPVVNLYDMLFSCGMDCNNYSATLIGWNANPLTPDNITLGAIGRQYGTNADAARTNLTTTKGWNIIGDSPSGTVCGAVPVPTISSFTPASGPVGTAVTITGTNFSTTPANDIVYFGATKATVTAATSTQLTVTVPTGATYQTITVQVNGLTAFSQKAFVVTFADGGVINTCSFAAPIGFSSGNFGLGTAMGDLDGDGKTDVAVTISNGNNVVRVFRNTSTTGTIDASSFATGVDLIVGTNPQGVAFSDIDGDGKLDIIATSFSDDIMSVFRNTSTSGTLTTASFSTRVDFTTGDQPFKVSCHDFDGDGKTDIAVSNNNSGTISIWRNIGIAGTITTGSFSPRINIPASVPALEIADIDVDGKPDLIVGQSIGSSIGVRRNISTPGVLTAASFATVVNFTVAPWLEYIAVGDLDSDNRPDIVTSSWPGNKISILKNTSTPGTITTSSFDPQLEIAGNVEPRGVVITDFDGDGYPDIGLANQTNNVSIYKNANTPGTITAAAFLPKVNFSGIGNARAILSGDIDGDGRPDLLTTNWGSQPLFVLRNTVSSLPIHSITTFTPTTGNVGTTVTITGTNFSTTPANNTVKFNGITATVTGSSATSLTVTVPPGTTTGTISLTVQCNTVTSTSSFSLPPVISSFSPASGPIGTTVTITGTNFNTTPTNNIVYFGATKATVTSATSTQLTVTVPAGATYQPITVSVSGLTAQSHLPFVVTFAGGGSFDNCSFAPSISLGTTAGFTRSAFADIDGDGKSDLLVPYSNDDVFAIFRNISTTGQIASTSFETKVDFITGDTPFGIATGDLDGDGKPDIAVINYRGGQLSIYKNLSTPGNILLAPKVDFTIPDFGHDVWIADVDGDGKQDLTITTSLAGMTVLRNTTTTGVINASSFAPGITFATGPNPNPFALGDMDGDGKLDAAIPNANAFSVSLLRNTSTPGTISFASQILLPITTGSPVPGSGSVLTAFGDIDDDGKLDLVVTTNTINAISLFRNTSALGTFSFDPQVALPVGEPLNKPVLSDLDGDGKIDLVTDFSSTGNLVYKNQATPGSINASTFSTPITFPKLPSRSILLGDVDGDGRNDIITTSATIQILQNLIGTIDAPVITSFSPLTGPEGTTVTINGNNFGSPFTNTVKINGITATITSSTAASLTITIPTGATSGPFDVTIGCNTVTSGTNFLVGTFIPTITSFTPASGPIGTSVTITGTNFSTTPANNSVQFNGITAYVVSSSATSITAIVPPGATTGSISVTVSSNTATSALNFTIVPFACPPGTRQGGGLDATFNPLVQSPASFTAVELQSTGKSVVATPSSIINGSSYDGLLRFNPDGSLDNSFASPISYYPNDRQLKVLPNDKILVVEVATVSYIKRLNADGSIDNTFNSPGYYASTVFSLGYQTDNKVLLSIYDDTAAGIFLYRLNADGTFDNSFTPVPDFNANVILQQADGKILAAGPSGVIRVEQSGSIDPTFATINPLDGDITEMVIQSNGKIVLVGTFTGIAGFPTRNIARLNSDGSIDTSFLAGNGFSLYASSQPNSIKLLAGDRLLVAGEFTTYNDEVRTRLLMLNADGSLYCSFDPQLGSDAPIVDAAVQPDGKILIVGSLTAYDGTPRNAFARVNGITVSCVPASERAALIALYNSTNGASWSFKDNWLSADESTWFGVGVTGCRVTTISMQNNNLSGSLPAELGNLTELKQLILVRHPNLTGAIPTEVGNLTKLQQLSLWNNNFTGAIPASMGNLSSLNIMELMFNQLSGSIPSSLGNLSTIDTLRLDNNQLTGAIPTSLFNLATLEQLALDNNQLTGTISALVGNLTNLKWLGLSGNQLTGSIPSEIGNIISLQGLILGRNQLTGSLPASIGNLVNLKGFNVFTNQLTGTLPSSMANLVNLTGLGLSVNQFTGAVPAGIGLIPNLNDVSLRDNDFTSIPTFVSNSFTDLLVYGNKLNFGHLEPNIGKTGFVYSPQDNLPGGTASACVGTTLTINFSTPGTANSYQWYKDGVLITGATSTNFVKANVTVADAGNYTVQVSNSIVTGLILQSDNFVVTVNSIPANPVANPVSVCPAGTATLTATGGTTGQYRWYNVASGGTAIAGQTNSTFVTPGISVVTTFYVSVLIGTCESTRTAVVVTPIGSACAPPTIVSTSISITIGNNKTLDLKTLITTTSGTLDVNSISVTVPPLSGAIATITGGVLTLDYKGVVFAGKEKITIRACDSNGNCSTQQIEIEVVGEIVVYNAVSPNGDDKNEFLMLQFIESISPKNQVSIYNRWGDEVFSISDYDNKARVFAGLSSGGSRLPAGTYFYKITLASDQKIKTGFISLK